MSDCLACVSYQAWICERYVHGYHFPLHVWPSAAGSKWYSSGLGHFFVLFPHIHYGTDHSRLVTAYLLFKRHYGSYSGPTTKQCTAARGPTGRKTRTNNPPPPVLVRNLGGTHHHPHSKACWKSCQLALERISSTQSEAIGELLPAVRSGAVKSVPLSSTCTVSISFLYNVHHF